MDRAVMIHEPKYTVTMFLVDVSPSMGRLRTMEIPPGPNGEKRTRKVTGLEWVLEFVMLKVQEMVNISSIIHWN